MLSDTHTTGSPSSSQQVSKLSSFFIKLFECRVIVERESPKCRIKKFDEPNYLIKVSSLSNHNILKNDHAKLHIQKNPRRTEIIRTNIS